MSIRVDPDLLSDIKKFGDINIEACFNCGNCTAVCPLSTDDVNFPRRMIRLAQVGMRDQLLGSKELWLCYNCGECSETCPRQAEPAEFMAAARRYAIANYDRSGLSRFFYTSPVPGLIFMVILALFIALFMYAQHGPMAADSLKLFEFIPYQLVHNLGVVGLAIVGLTGLLGMLNMITRIGREDGLLSQENGVRRNWLGAIWQALGVEVLGQKRYRKECEANKDGAPWYFSAWFIHAMAMWGFLGLLVATSLDFLLDIVGIKETGTAVPVWYPVRLLGTIAGLLFVYGLSAMIIKRVRKRDRALSHSLTSDWILLIWLWLSGVSGFITELALYLPQVTAWGYWIFLFHMVISMEVVLLLPFTKFAHAIYRSVALYFYALKPVKKEMSALNIGTD